MNIENLTNSLNCSPDQYAVLMKSVINILESIMPGISDQINSEINKKISQNETATNDTKRDDLEDVKRNLLQEEQNLTEDINKLEKDIEECSNKLNSMNINLDNLKAKRSDVHQKWCNMFAANNVEQKPQITVKSVFNKYFAAVFCPHASDEILKEFKKFDNLIHRRCQTSMIFGDYWNVACILDYLEDHASTDEYNYIDNIVRNS